MEITQQGEENNNNNSNQFGPQNDTTEMMFTPS